MTITPVSEESSRLRPPAVLRVMVDNSVAAEAVTHTTGWVFSGEHRWGPHPITAGHFARVQRDFSGDSRLKEEVTALAGIVGAAEKHGIEFVETIELRIERWRQPAGRFLGFGLFDRQIEIPATLLSHQDNFVLTKENLSEEAQHSRLRGRVDQPFKTLMKFLDPHILDAWHLHCCEITRTNVFMTLDRKFFNAVEQSRKSRLFPTLKTEVLFPSTLARRLNIAAGNFDAAISENADFFVEPALKAPHRRFGGKKHDQG